MILIWLILILFIGGVAAWLAGGVNSKAPRVVALITVLIDLLLFLSYCSGLDLSTAINAGDLAGSNVWIVQFMAPWIPQFGINFLFAMDGVTLTLNLLTLFLGVVAIFAAWSEIDQKTGFFYFNLLWVLAGVIGVFTALDLFLFFFFWEVMLIPMYLLIAVWGHEKKEYAALKFFIFTQVSGLLMLLSILALVSINYQQTGVISFSYMDLLGTQTDSDVGMWIMLGFFVAFVVKLPGVPLHNWLPDAHTQAPTAGSVILAGVLLKTGAYGLLRFIFPLFPEAATAFAPIAMTLGVISVLYGAKLAFAQYDMKRLIAYTSISHMGFILIGVFAWNTLALQGAVMQMLAHGVSSAALFALAGGLQHRLHTRDLREMGGFWTIVPRTGAIALFFLIAALGLPGLGNFVGESMVLFGAFIASPTVAVFATIGVIFAPVYALKVAQDAFQGETNSRFDVSGKLTDLAPHELLMMGSMIAVLVVMGLYPQPLIDTLAPAIDSMHQLAQAQISVIGR
ncbi:MAG: NADH-quinone oxidoreductase subunit M [Halieaceae bacterium]|jgi:NADH-quinone oxidoreductase subunit M|nr:NADH-quinone oxidoreductase subunit M [Halieaceae bacterium]